MFCPKCGTQLPDGSSFCGTCGTNLAGGQQKSNIQVNLLNSKPASWKDSNFAFVALAGLLALISTFLIHCPVISVGVKGLGAELSASFTLLDAGKFNVEHLQKQIMNMSQSFNPYSMTRPINVPKLDLGSQAIVQIIFTVLVIGALVYLFLPYIKKINMNMSVLNYIIPLAILVSQLIFFIVAVATNPMGDIFNTYVRPLLANMPTEMEQYGIGAHLGLSLDGWLFYFSNIAAIGLLTWQMIVSIIKK